MRNILITGGAGFIGYHLSKRLAADESNKIVVVDSLDRGRMDNYFSELVEKSNVRFFKADLTDPKSLAELEGQSFDEIYHFAAIVGVKHCMNVPDKVLNVNLLSTINVVNFANASKSKNFMFASTCENYASGFELGVIPVPTPENVPMVITDIKNPRLTYAGSKIVGEQLTVFNAKNYEYRIVRFHNVFGPRMGFAHVIPEITKRIHAKESPFKMYGADQTRAFCYVEDAVTQVIGVMRSAQAKNEVIHVGNSSEEIKIGDVVRKIFKLMSYDPATEASLAPPGSVNRRCPDVSKVQAILQKGPEYTFDEALRITVNWYNDLIKKGDVWE